MEFGGTSFGPHNVSARWGDRASSLMIASPDNDQFETVVMPALFQGIREMLQELGTSIAGAHRRIMSARTLLPR